MLFQIALKANLKLWWHHHLVGILQQSIVPQKVQAVHGRILVQLIHKVEIPRRIFDHLVDFIPLCDKAHSEQKNQLKLTIW
jgi:hypothetical protein